MLFRAYERKKFLIVDDFDSFVVSLKQMLRSLGAIDIQSARNGDEAIEACLNRHYDIVFCDYNMGDRKNGQQVLEELKHRKLLRNTDVFCMISAEAGKDMVFGALEYQPDAYITKPLTRALLQNRVDKLLEMKESVYEINEAIDLENHAKAISLCAKHLRVDSKYKIWLYRTQANLFYTLGDYEHAKKIYTEILAKRDIDWARMGLARVLLAEGHAAEAEAELDYLLQQNPQLVEAYDLKADAHRQQNQMKYAQQSLMAAAAVSPRAIGRQRKLAALSVELGDLDQAMLSYKQAVKLSDNSCLETPDTYLDYAKVIETVTSQALAKEGDPNASREAEKLLKEATQVLDTARRRYHADPAVVMRAHLAEAGNSKAAGKEARADKALAKAEEVVHLLAEDPDSSLDPDVLISMAQTLFDLGRAEAGNELLVKLSVEHASDPALSKRIAELQEEPVSMTKKSVARAQNKSGIQAYEQNEFETAVVLFRQALEITPLHSGLNLNFVQALIKLSAQRPLDPQLLAAGSASLTTLSKLTEHDKQYKRYAHLQKRFASLGAPA